MIMENENYLDISCGVCGFDDYFLRLDLILSLDVIFYF